MTPSERAILLFGTDEPVEPPLQVAAGPLSFEFDRGDLRHIRWHGVEVVRGVAFVLRDARWGTHAQTVSNLTVKEGRGEVEIAFEAGCDHPEGDFAYHASIRGSADGTLLFQANGGSSRSFTTCRTGFIVLHPLRRVVGREVRVEHCTGRSSTSRFPDLVSPSQPISDIRELAHRPDDGCTLRIRMEGEAFEMEDHRNWTDASFKTYVRPLSKGYPYTIEADEPVVQAVTVSLSGTIPAEAVGTGEAVVRIGGSRGSVPRLGLFVEPRDVAAARAMAPQLRALRPAYLIGRVDLRDQDAHDRLAALDDLAKATDSRLSLQLIIAALFPRRELDGFVRALATVSTIESLHVIPARDLNSRPADQTPEGEATPETILAAAREAFPGMRIGGGMPVPFAELNRNRPPRGIDFLTHATQANVHAADDTSIMETLEALPDVIRSARSFAGNVPYRLGPSTIGTSRFTAPGHVAPNPDRRRMTMSADDPRHRALFGAAFAVGLTAVAAAERLEGLTFASAAGAAGILFADGRPTPAAAFFGRFTSLGGARSIETHMDDGSRLAALVVQSDTGTHLFLANCGPRRRRVTVSDFRCHAVQIIDAQTLAGGEPNPDAREAAAIDGVIELDAYGVAILDLHPRRNGSQR